MSPANEQHDVYKTHQHKNESWREIEARVLLNAANSLEEARRPGTDQAFYRSVLQRNQRLWVIFQVALCDPENPLPQDLKTLLLNLSVYINKLSFRAIAQYQPDLLKSLININRRIAAGLNVKLKLPDQAPAPEAITPPPPAADRKGTPATSVSTTA
jgi:flagellar protein FlaF